MIDELEKLRKEIERRLEELNPKKGTFMGRPLRDVNPKTFPRESELEKLLSIIDSMQKEHASEELEEVAKEYSKFERGDDTEADYDINRYEGFIAGAQWQKQQFDEFQHSKELLYVCNKTAERTKREIVSKACEAFCKVECDGKPPRSTCTSLGTCRKHDDFRKAMEE